MSHRMPAARPARTRAQSMRIFAAALVVLGASGVHVTATAQSVQLGLGSYRTELKRGDPTPPVAEFVTGEALGKAAPTNQWYSSVMFQRWSQPIHALPMTYRATENGFELGLPVKRVATVDGSREVKYAHTPAIVVSPAGFKPQDARLAKFSDWLAKISMAGSDGAALTATVLHGSPFSYYEVSAGDVRFQLAATPDASNVPTDAEQGDVGNLDQGRVFKGGDGHRPGAFGLGQL